MSDMQLYLIALGAIIIAAVMLFNWWQERRLSRDAVMRFASPTDDPLLDDFRIEPHVAIDPVENAPYIESTVEPSDEAVPAIDHVLEVEPAEEVVALSPAEHDHSVTGLEMHAESPEAAYIPLRSYQPEQQAHEESNLHPHAETLDAAGAAASPVEFTLPANVDEQIDLVARIHLSTPAPGMALREALQPLPSFDKPTQWYGLDIAGTWQALTRDQEQVDFICLACALQLADRAGTVSRQTLRDFQLKVEEAANKLGGMQEWRGDSDPLRYAAELDQFCIDVDVMVGFHIQQGGNGPFAATKLRGLAEASGMTLKEDGAFHYQNDAGETLFTLVNQDQRPFTAESMRTAFIRGISFQIDVPRVKNCMEVFNQMVLVARKMESSLGGILLDDHQHALSDEAMDKIRQQLKIIYSKMVARGIIPGSQTALRLFS